MTYRDIISEFALEQRNIDYDHIINRLPVIKMKRSCNKNRNSLKKDKQKRT